MKTKNEVGLKWYVKRLGDLVSVRTGKLDANASSPDGIYPFFTCSKEPLKIDTFSYDCECVLVAGNGDLNVKYYQGKFDAYQRTYIIESKDKAVLLIRYLYYFLDTYLEKLREQSIGGVIKYIKLENLTEAKIPLPPLATQQRIAAILDAADALRRKDQELLRKYDELAQAIFIDMFGDPVKNEKGWEVKKFLEFSIFENGDRSSNYPTQKDLVVNGIPFFGTNDITNGQLSDFGLRFISTEKFNSLGRGKLKYNDLVITLRGSIGNCAIFNSSFFETGFINAQMMIIRTESQIIEPVFLQFLYLSDSFQRSLISITGGSAVPQITSAQVKDFIAIAPPISMQRDFIEQLEKIKNLIKNCSKELSSQLFNSLLQQAFNGELVA